MTTHAMSPVDVAWFHMDGPANSAVVTAVALTKEPLDFKKLCGVVKRRLLSFDRFRQRVVEGLLPLSSPEWEDIPDFDVEHHVHQVALPSPRTEVALLALIDDLASTPLDRTQALWQIHIVDKFKSGSVLILRYHHCIGDGTAMMTVASRLFDMPADAIPHRPSRVPNAEEHTSGLLDDAGLVLRGAGSLVAELLKWPDPSSPFKGNFGSRKRVAWSQPVDIEDVKAIGTPAGAKVNDVLVAATAGALRAYLRKRGVDVNHTTLRAMVPVDLRAPEQLGELGNEFGLVILDLPVAEAKAVKRLASTKSRMDAIKRSPQAVAMRLLLNVFGRGPKPIEDLACRVFGSKASVVLTNVMGPRVTVGLAGVPVDRMMFCVPHPGEDLGMGISILSYGGTATLTVIADARLVPDPHAITQLFNREFAAMRRRAIA